MICYPIADKTTPIIVAGPQRSGTRFITNVLNSVPGVTIHGEIPAPVINNIIKVIRKCDQKYLRENIENSRKNWSITKRDFMFAAWANLNKGKRKKPDENCVFYGYKTPFHEKYFDFYNTFFDPIQPKYVCCVRGFIDHYLSVQARWPAVQARWPERNILFVAWKYVQSLRQLRYMKAQRPNDVLLFFLDDYKKIGFQYLRDRIFSPLGLYKLEAAQRRAAKGAVNTAEQKGVQKKTQLTILQALYLKTNPQALQAYDLLRRDYG